jgi:hypothetical protein
MIFRVSAPCGTLPTRNYGRQGAAMRARWGRALAGCAVLASVSGCGFLRDMAEPDPAPVIPLERTEQPAAQDPAPTGPVVVAEGTLLGGQGGRLTVTVGEVQTGLVPPVPNFADSCPVDPLTLQYLPVEFAFSVNGGVVPGLAARVEVSVGPETPTDIGDVGVVVESGDGTEQYCFDYPPLPTSDRFWNQMGAATISGYVVLDQAVTAATPQGRDEVFPTLRLRISELRLFSDPEEVQALRLGNLSVGAPCPDDPEAICVPLG